MTNLPNASTLLAALVALPGPPGQEEAVREYVRAQTQTLGFSNARTDAKGNLLICVSGEENAGAPDVVVTAHMDEIALMVTGVFADGVLSVSALGGAHPWKWGEGPVEILGRDGAIIPGILGFGGIHTNHPAAVVSRARSGEGVTWDMARVVTGLSADALAVQGVRVGSRVCVARSRRSIFPLGGNLIGSYFFDDRADIAAWLLALQTLRENPLTTGKKVVFCGNRKRRGRRGRGTVFAARGRGNSRVYRP